MPHPPAAKPTHPLVRDFIAAHRLDWSDHHRTNAVSVLNRWHRWCTTAGVELVAATMDDCTAYIAGRVGVVSKSTAVKDYQFMSWLYAWLREEGELPGRDPMARVKGLGKVTPDPRRKPRVQPGDFDKLMASFDKRKLLDCRNAAICSLMYRSGARRSEVVRADLDRLDLDGQALMVIGKSGEWETLQLTAETCRLLERYLRRRGDDRSPALFIGSRGTAAGDGRLRPDAVSGVLERRAARLGVRVPAHGFRRAMAVNAKGTGMNDTTVQHIGRWRDPRMLTTYQQDAQAELSAAEFHRLDPTARSTTRPARRTRRLRSVG